MRQVNALKKLCQILQLPDPGSLSYDSDKVRYLWKCEGQEDFIVSLFLDSCPDIKVLR